MRKNGFIPLQNIVIESDFILVDTCALDKYTGLSIGTNDWQKQYESVRLWESYFEAKCCNITLKVLDECLDWRKKLSIEIEENLEEFNEDIYRIKKLTYLLQNGGVVLRLNQDERIACDILSGKYAYLGVKAKAGDTDINLLMEGATLAQKRNVVSLISNDGGISKSWKELLKEEREINEENLRLYKREGYNRFRKIDLF